MFRDVLVGAVILTTFASATPAASREPIRERKIDGTIHGLTVDLAGGRFALDAWQGAVELKSPDVDGLSGGWSWDPEGFALELGFVVVPGARAAELTFHVRGNLIPVPSGASSAVALVAPRTGEVLSLRLVRTEGGDGRPIPSTFELVGSRPGEPFEAPTDAVRTTTRRVRLLLDLDGVPSPARVSLRLTRNTEIESDDVRDAPTGATCGMTGVLASSEDRDAFTLPGLDDLVGALVLVRGTTAKGAPLLLVAGSAIRLEPATEPAGEGYEIDWIDRRRFAQPTLEVEPNDLAGQANVAANDVFSGILESSRDRDQFRFSAGAGDRILVVLATGRRQGSPLGPAVLLTVRDEAGRVVAFSSSSDDASARNFDGAAVAFRASAEGAFVAEVAASEATNGPVGAYTLAVSRNCSPSPGLDEERHGGADAASYVGSSGPGPQTPAGMPQRIANAATPSPAELPNALLAAPAEIDDSVRVDRAVPAGATIRWTAAEGTFNVYRGSRSASSSWSYNQSCFATATTATSVTDAQAPASGELFYYLVSRQSGCEESVLGRNSGGTPTPASGLCFSPGTGLLPAKPYFMVAFDTSGSMTTAVAGANTCGLPTNRLGHGRCALRNMIQAYSGQANFGLATYAVAQSGCSGACYTGCAYNGFPPDTTGCGNEPDPGAPGSSSRRGANIVVPMQADDFWNAVPQASNVNQMLAWADNNCTGNVELFAQGNTPLNGVLRDMFRYLSSGWGSPVGGGTFPSPLGASGQDRSCRSVNVVLITDGDETCDTQADAVAAALALRTGFTRLGITWSVKTYVINFAGGSVANTDQIAAAGGTGASYLVSNEAELSQALSAIIGGAAQRETCDNADNNCNGCIDEGYLHFGNVQSGPTGCCVWTTAAQRTTCLTNYGASISPAVPRGDPSLLPCTTAEQQSDPATWLCYDPGDPCDGLDNNGDGSVDEGQLKCGSPLHCPTTEICNGLDDDCDALVDEGGVCPLSCVATPEICDGCDNDCDGIADEGIAPVTCGQAAPINCVGTQSCRAPQAVAIGGCAAVGGWNPCANNPTTETCDGRDNDCNGAVDDSPACPCASRQERCNGIDDNCNASVDEGVTPPNPAQVCGVGPAATSPECTTEVTVSCVAGGFQCTFPAGVCNGPGGCAGTAEVCDALDNNCDGRVNETVPKFGEPCASDDGLPAPGHGACRTTGTFVCASPTTTACSAVAANCASLPGGCTELCDGIDNDCDGRVDETFASKGSNAAFFVKPSVTRTAAALWQFSHEASRPNADLRFPGLGNGYFTSAPAGVPLEKTIACSTGKRVPWFTVTAAEAEQSCQAIGGRLCTLAEWQTGCRATASCTWGYSPRGAACTTAFTATKRCNLGPSWDFNPSIPGDQDGLLAVAAAGPSCYADWSGLLGNPAGSDRLNDITGNLRELVAVGPNQYAVMGGAFNSASEAGAACGFSFYQVDQSYSGYDVGFRCCFSVDPTQ